ncbi:MAG TPA: hypothetical protein VMT34_09785 [Aggregatilineales bacterium]|nr:hypothetical protein [Aggregatilineales bacterium]
MRILKLIVVGLCVAAGLSACESVADNPLCGSYASILPASDGDSRPDTVAVVAGQKLTIDYVAIFDSGSAEFKVLDANQRPIWSTTIAKAANTKTIVVPTDLQAGNYDVILTTHNVVNGTLCWKGNAR